MKSTIFLKCRPISASILQEEVGGEVVEEK
jgi:hypothetical protein